MPEDRHGGMLVTPYSLTADQLAQYQSQGFVIVPGLFTPAEVTLLHQVARADRALAKAGSMADSKGGASKIWITTDLKEDVYSAFTHNHRVVNPVRQIFTDEPLFYHHKMMLKEPRTGGAWEWHQDYGYWYNDGFIFPNMASCMIAVDGADRENGCLQVLAGSHHMGRIQHGKVGNQVGADVERVAEAAKRLELVYCEMAPGTALFFHCNLLHRSDQNLSERSRWSLICCYTAAQNRSYRAADKPWYNCQPVTMWDDARISELGERQAAAQAATAATEAATA
jgi:ectoine hydroxylase